jgi:Zn-dependent membrane protease YugP
MGIYLIFGIFSLISWYIGSQLKSRFKEFANYPLPGGRSGKDVAEQMLADHGITDVQVISVEGELTDHYHPVKKTVNLSPDVYHGTHVSAAAVAAHECGHAVQHAQAYAWLNMRSKLVPFVSLTSNWLQWVLLAGILLITVFPYLLLLGIFLLALTTLFSIITLPVEFDASRRALEWISKKQIVASQDYPKAATALNWAAATYVVAALSSLATLAYYVMIYLSGSRRNN